MKYLCIVDGELVAFGSRFVSVGQILAAAGRDPACRLWDEDADYVLDPVGYLVGTIELCPEYTRRFTTLARVTA